MGVSSPAFGEELISYISSYKNNNPDPGSIGVKTICKEANSFGQCDCNFKISYFDDSIHTRGMNKNPYSVVGNLNSTGNVHFTATFTDGLELNSYIITGGVTIPKCDPQPFMTKLIPMHEVLTYGKPNAMEVQSKISRSGIWKASVAVLAHFQDIKKLPEDTLKMNSWVTTASILPNLD